MFWLICMMRSWQVRQKLSNYMSTHKHNKPEWLRKRWCNNKIFSIVVKAMFADLNNREMGVIKLYYLVYSLIFCLYLQISSSSLFWIEWNGLFNFQHTISETLRDQMPILSISNFSFMIIRLYLILRACKLLKRISLHNWKYWIQQKLSLQPTPTFIFTFHTKIWISWKIEQEVGYSIHYTISKQFFSFKYCFVFFRLHVETEK